LSRQKPHVLCQGFLPLLGRTPAKHWRVGRHNFDAEEAVELVWKRLAPACKQAEAVMLGLPGYVTAQQANLVRTPGDKARVPLTASLPVPLAAALAAYADQAWFESALVLDVDDHALTISLVRAGSGQAHLLEVRSLPHLGFHAWRERLLNALSDC